MAGSENIWNIWHWVGFNAFLLVALFLDLVVSQHKDHAVGIREALIRTVVWTAVAGVVGAWIFIEGGTRAGTLYTTAYVVERALSIDNLFVFLVIFAYFKVPKVIQSRALTIGILGALLFRALFIVVGVAVINAFAPILFALGAFLIFTGFKLAFQHDKEVDPTKNLAFKLTRKLLPVTDRFDGHKFFTIENGVRFATPFLLVVIVLETTDIVFAIDSVPSVLAITTDGFLVWTSNTMAVLGMRPLYFLLAGLVALFRYLQYGLAAVLGFIGAKMIFNETIHQFDLNIHIDEAVETYGSLGIVLLVLAGSVLLSKLIPAKGAAPHAAAPAPASPVGGAIGSADAQHKT